LRAAKPCKANVIIFDYLNNQTDSFTVELNGLFELNVPQSYYAEIEIL